MKKILVSCLAVVMCLMLSVTAFASNFTPSVESKPAPELVPITDAQGNQVSVILTDAEGNQVGLPENLELVITPTSEKSGAVLPEIQAMLERAEAQIADAADLGELTPELAAALEALKANSTDPAILGISLSDLVVRDLFDVSFVRDGKTLEDLLAEGYTVTFAIKTDLTEDDLYFVLHNYSGSMWEVVDQVAVQDGVMTITLGSLSPIAIVVNGGSVLATAEDAPASPQTGARFPVEYLGGAVILAGAAVFFFCKAKKQKAA